MILYIGNNLATPTNNVTTLQLLANLLKKEGYTILCTSSKVNRLSRLFDMLYSIIKQRKKIQYILIDTYSTHNFYYAFLSSQLARVLNLKYIPILHGGNLPNRLRDSSKMSQLLFKNSYRNIAPSNYLKSEFKKYGYESDFIPNVLEVATYKFKNRGDFQPKLLYVRALHKLYNPQMAIRVLAKLQQEFPLAELCMVGPDKDGSLADCKALANKLGVFNSITFTGLLPKQQWHELSEIYDVFINTTTIDNTPVSVMEAMALGLLVISTDVGGIPYLIKNKETGLLVTSNNPNEMTDAVKDVVSNPLKYNKITSLARSAVEQFDWEIVKEDWKGLLK
jgi:glycosyltransferase involved in cell wall biosynthesis